MAGEGSMGKRVAREGSRGRGWRGWGGGWNFKGHSEIDYRLLGATTK